MWKLLIVLLGVGWGSAEIEKNEFVFHIEHEVDGVLPVINNYLHGRKLDRVVLPDFVYLETPLFTGVTLKNLSTMFRTGEAVMWQSAIDSTTFKVNVGLRDMKVHIDLNRLSNSSTNFTIGSSSVEVSFTWRMISSKICETKWNYFHIKKLEGIVGDGEGPKWGNWQPYEWLVPEIIEHYNKWLNIQPLLDKLSKDVNICEI